jgi:CRISPR type IV-associated protein Csf3
MDKLMNKFTLSVKLKSPLITGGGYMTLDALLAAIIFDDCGDIDKAHSDIPLKNTDGLWHGSAGFLEPIAIGKQVFVANLRAMHDLEPDMIAKNSQGRVHRRIGATRRGDYGPVLNSYQIITAEVITWYGEGDIDKVKELISTISFIGKRRANGFGEIESIDLEESDLDGVLGYTNEPLRPIPESLFQGDTSSLRADAAWRPAYWHPDNRAVCYVPQSSL